MAIVQGNTAPEVTAAIAVAPIVETPVLNAAVAAVLNGAPAAAVTAAVAAVALPETGIAPQAAVVQVVEEVSAADPVGTTAATADAAPEAPKTRGEILAAKITAKQLQYGKLADEIAKLEQQFRAVDLLDSVKQGSVIIAKVGRADTAKEVEASVIGVQTLENGDRRLKIFFGDGFDSETVIIQDSQIVDVKQA